MKILFISRAYPPIVGGVENQNYELGKWLGKIAEVNIIANKKGRKFLPLFAPYALIKVLFLLPKYDAVLLGDGVISILAWFLKFFSRKPVICVIHGLDINWDSASLGVWYEKILIKIYHALWIKRFLPVIDKFIAVGNETVRVGIAHGIPSEKIVFIPNGVDTEKNLVNANRKDLANILEVNTDDKQVILTSGRLARRKGVAWFITNVMPKLPNNIIYVIAGNGPDKENVINAIKESNLANRVITLGYVTDEVRNILFATCDLFIQPNIKIKGDMEGFGISVIEAGACKLPVIASRLEGLQDAIVDGKNGFLIESGDAQGYINKITELLSDKQQLKVTGEAVRKFVVETYDWKIISQRYMEEISKTIK